MSYYKLARITIVCVSLCVSCTDNFLPCKNVDCSGHGDCLDSDDEAVCVCHTGYSPSSDGLDCLPEGADGDADGDVDPCEPSVEICNHIDDDCDGVVDEDFDLDSDPEHCGACDNICPADPQNASSQCLGGSCVIECDHGSANCDDDLADGCETRLGTPTSCNDCDDQCALTHPFCEYDPEQGFICVTNCEPSALVCSGSCVDVSRDTAHCGECDHLCPSAPHSSPLCAGGVCGLECDEGWGDCLGAVDDGCETSLLTLTDCGACGEVCELQNAIATCSTGSCALGSCVDGYGNCDESPENGCEIDLISSTDCGSCGNTCDPMDLCLDGVCDYECPDSCECSQHCEEYQPCVCESGCHCELDCDQFCEVYCVDAETVCDIELRAHMEYSFVGCSGGAACFLDVVEWPQDSSIICSGVGTTCEVMCDGHLDELLLDCRDGAECILAGVYSDCAFDECDGELLTCDSGIMTCNRPCP